MFLFYVFYLGGLAFFALIVHSLASNLWLSLLAPLVAIGYVILVPYCFVRCVHTRHARFIRCPHCGDWFGQDASGAYFGPNPKFKGIIDTGRCSKCGTQILTDHESTAQMLSAVQSLVNTTEQKIARELRFARFLILNHSAATA